MKLYTEEQLREAYLSGMIVTVPFEQLLQRLTPVSLPSDEEIEEIAKEEINLSADCFGQYDFTSGKQDGFIEGMHWLRDKIQGGNK